MDDFIVVPEPEPEEEPEEEPVDEPEEEPVDEPEEEPEDDDETEDEDVSFKVTTTAFAAATIAMVGI